MNEIRPLARTDGLVSEPLDDGLFVRHEDEDTGHRLNASAALVWQNCDGERTVDDLTEILQAEFGDIADENLVMIALDDLQEHDLLEAGFGEREPSATRVSRRRFLQRVGVAGAAAVAIPIVYATKAPSPSSGAAAHYYS